jgi:BirA family biotin operon repressor/biotin-[acetyl-CoA-carboxylase] ligase
LSIVLAAPDQHASLLPLALGAYVAEALDRRYQIPLALKWPNDIVVVNGGSPSRKLSGILVDRVTSPRLGAAAVAGIGVNVTTDRAELSASARERVAVLSELCRVPPELEEVEQIVVEAALSAAASARTATGLEEVRKLCRRRLWGVGRRAEVDGHPVGTIVALGDEGELWVEDQGERMAIRAGDLRVEETP